MNVIQLHSCKCWGRSGTCFQTSLCSGAHACTGHQPGSAALFVRDPPARMPEQEVAPATNTAMRIGTSHLVPPPPSGPHAVPPPSMARPPHPPAASLSMQTQATAPAAMNNAAAAEAHRTFTPAAASSQGTAQTAATPLVSHAQVQSSATPHGSQSRRIPANGSAEHRACNCKNSRCLKLYCECFASGRYCNACNCSNCMNNKDHEQARSKAIETILERNPNAFRPKIQIQQVR